MVLQFSYIDTVFILSKLKNNFFQPRDSSRRLNLKREKKNNSPEVRSVLPYVQSCNVWFTALFSFSVFALESRNTPSANLSFKTKTDERNLPESSRIKNPHGAELFFSQQWGDNKMQKCVIRFARAAKLEQCKIITDIIPGGKQFCYWTIIDNNVFMQKRSFFDISVPRKSFH